jgi:hypothetical protein
METETDIMKNLNMHLGPNIRESEVINTHKGNFKKHGTVSEVETRQIEFERDLIRQRNFTSNGRRPKFKAHLEKNKFIPIETKEGAISPLPGINQKGPLKESHFFDMIDQIQKESQQFESREKLLNRQTEGNWFESLSRKKPY